MPRWIIPIFKPDDIRLDTLSTTENGTRKYLFKPSLPRPDVEIGDYWIWNTSTVVFCNKPVPEVFIKKILGYIPRLVQTFGKVSIFGEVDGFFSITLGPKRRTDSGISIINPDDLFDEALWVTKEQAEQIEWNRLESEFNSYLIEAKEDLENAKKETQERYDRTVKEMFAIMKELEVLERTSFDSSAFSLITEIEKLKKIPSVRKVYARDGKIAILLQPIITGHEGIQYFMGEYEIAFFKELPEIINLSYKLGSGHFHPHISPDRVCFGQFASVFTGLLKKRDFESIVKYCISFIQKYNPSSPFKTIDLFPVWDGVESKIKSSSSVQWLKKYPQWGIV